MDKITGKQTQSPEQLGVLTGQVPVPTRCPKCNAWHGEKHDCAKGSE